MSLTLTFDLGTTYFKAALFDEQGELQALARRRLEVSHPESNRWELKVENFHDSICELAHELKESYGALDSVKAICFATQANSFALLDKHDRPITPIILWPDERARDDTPSIETVLDGIWTYSKTGMPAINHMISSAKLLWIRKIHEKAWQKTRRIAFISDCLTLWLTGEHTTEAGAAGLSAMVDVQKLCWCPEVLERLDISEQLLPQIARAGTDLGTIRPEAANELGVPTNTRVILGCLDQYAGAIGAGNVKPGGLSETTGTVLATVQCSDQFQSEPKGGIFQGPGFDDGVFFRMVFGDVSANLLERYRDSLPDKPSFDDLTRAASKVPSGAEGLRLRDLPHQLPPADMFFNRQPHHQRGHEVRAILEAVAGALADQVSQLTGGTKSNCIHSTGGAARSQVWRQIKANTLGCPVIATACQEPTSLGAAILATATLSGQTVEKLAKQWVKTLPPNMPA